MNYSLVSDEENHQTKQPVVHIKQPRPSPLLTYKAATTVKVTYCLSGETKLGLFKPLLHTLTDVRDGPFAADGGVSPANAELAVPGKLQTRLVDRQVVSGKLLLLLALPRLGPSGLVGRAAHHLLLRARLLAHLPDGRGGPPDGLRGHRRGRLRPHLGLLLHLRLPKAGHGRRLPADGAEARDAGGRGLCSDGLGLRLHRPAAARARHSRPGAGRRRRRQQRPPVVDVDGLRLEAAAQTVAFDLQVLLHAPPASAAHSSLHHKQHLQQLQQQRIRFGHSVLIVIGLKMDKVLTTSTMYEVVVCVCVAFFIKKAYCFAF